MAPSIGFVTQTGMDLQDVIPRAGERGFSHVEILLEGNNDRRRFDPRMAGRLADENDVDIHVHLPFYLDVASPKEHVRRGGRREVQEAIEVAGAAGAGKAILHAGTRAWTSAWDHDVVKSHLLESIAHLDGVARTNDVELCAENLKSEFFTLREDFPDLLAETDVGVCLNAGHALRRGWSVSEIRSFVSDPANRVSHLHLEDPRDDGADHLPLGAGSTDFSELLAPLEESSWPDTVSIEVYTYDFEYLSASKERVEAFFR